MEEFVPNFMPHRLVEGPEVVKVDTKEGNSCVRHHRKHRFGKPLVEKEAVGKPGERVVAGQIGNPRLGPLALLFGGALRRNIKRQADQSNGLTCDILRGAAVDPDPMDGPVRPNAQIFDFEVLARRPGEFHLPAVTLFVVRMHARQSRVVVGCRGAKLDTEIDYAHVRSR